MPRPAIVLTLAVAALAAAAAVPLTGTFAGFTDGHTGGGAFTADVTGAPVVDDPGHAYEDLDNDGRFDADVDVALANATVLDGGHRVTTAGAGLVIPAGVGPIDVPGAASFSAGPDGGHLTIGVDVLADGPLTLTASGDVRAAGVRLHGDGVTLDADGDVKAARSDLDAGAAEVHVHGNDVDLRHATLLGAVEVKVDAVGDALLMEAHVSTAGEVGATAAGLLDAQAATLDAGTEVVLDAGSGLHVSRGRLEARDEVRLTGAARLVATDATIRAGGDVTLDAGAGLVLDDALVTSADAEVRLLAGGDVDATDATLTAATELKAALAGVLAVDGASLRDADDTLQAGPGCVTVQGTPRQGNVATDC